MNQSQVAWTNVWNSGEEKGTYGYQEGRFERALDKVDHCNQLGIKFHANERVLEAGCGDGSVIITLQRLFSVNGFGVDFAESAKKQAELLMQKENCSFVFNLADIRTLPFADSYFDKIICLGVVEHMESPVVALRELRRVLKPGGQAIIMTPNFYSAGVLDRILQQALGRWNMGFQKEFSPKKLAEFLRTAGFSQIDKRALARRRLHRDSGFRKIATYIDGFLSYFSSSWGFYSYTFATKE